MSVLAFDGGIYPDNVKLVEAFGGRGERVYEAKDLEGAFVSEAHTTDYATTTSS